MGRRTQKRSAAASGARRRPYAAVAGGTEVRWCPLGCVAKFRAEARRQRRAVAAEPPPEAAHSTPFCPRPFLRLLLFHIPGFARHSPPAAPLLPHAAAARERGGRARPGGARGPHGRRRRRRWPVHTPQVGCGSSHLSLPNSVRRCGLGRPRLCPPARLPPLRCAARALCCPPPWTRVSAAGAGRTTDAGRPPCPPGRLYCEMKPTLAFFSFSGWLVCRCAAAVRRIPPPVAAVRACRVCPGTVAGAETARQWQASRADADQQSDQWSDH